MSHRLRYTLGWRRAPQSASYYEVIKRREFLGQWDLVGPGTFPACHLNRIPQLQLFRSGTAVQAALLLSDSTCPRQGPLAPRALPRFRATVGLSDSRGSPLPVMDSLQGLAAWPPPPRVSQVPQHDCPNAPSPNTPGCPAVAHAHCFTPDVRLHHIWQAGRTLKNNEAEMGSLALGLIRSQSRSLRSLASHPNGGDRPASRARLPSHRGPLLRDERAIITADSFQSASRTRLGLAHPTIQNYCRFIPYILF